MTDTLSPLKRSEGKKEKGRMFPSGLQFPGVNEAQQL